MVIYEGSFGSFDITCEEPTSTFETAITNETTLTTATTQSLSDLINLKQDLENSIAEKTARQEQLSQTKDDLDNLQEEMGKASEAISALMEQNTLSSVTDATDLSTSTAAMEQNRRKHREVPTTCPELQQAVLQLENKMQTEDFSGAITIAMEIQDTTATCTLTEIQALVSSVNEVKSEVGDKLQEIEKEIQEINVQLEELTAILQEISEQIEIDN